MTPFTTRDVQGGTAGLEMIPQEQPGHGKTSGVVAQDVAAASTRTPRGCGSGGGLKSNFHFNKGSCGVFFFYYFFTHLHLNHPCFITQCPSERGAPGPAELRGSTGGVLQPLLTLGGG